MRQVPPDVIVERELAIQLQQQHARGRELLGHRAEIEDGLWRDGDALFERRHPIALGIRDRTRSGFGQSAAWDVRFRDICEDIVEAPDDGAIQHLRTRGVRIEHRERGQNDRAARAQVHSV